ncbi:MAG: extracellular solute-binding protein [Spirochaetales bacterium]|jgi:iron(III) transport system substrate-binding protein|nr:extracellular solute-binding protein [Spirochaetales bacterium]
MKKFISLLIVLSIAASLFAGGGNETSTSEATDKLVVYSPNSDGLLNATIPAFEEKYGVKVEVISAGTGEVFKRLQGEANSPYADVVFGGAYATYMINEALFDPYTSVNNGNIIDIYQNTTGFITPYVLDGSLILVNKSLIGDIDIKGYKDLLNPALKGKIVSANPTASSSAYAHLTNMLNAIGDGDYQSEEAWEFVKALFTNTVVIGSSSSVWKGVRDGEYTIGLSYEDPSVQLVRDGADVKVVYMDEGVVYLPAGSGVVKGAKNLVNARRFIDFITSAEIQNVYGTSITNRPVMADVATPDYMVNIKDINIIAEDMEYVYQNKAALQEKFKDIFVEIQG